MHKTPPCCLYSLYSLLYYFPQLPQLYSSFKITLPSKLLFLNFRYHSQDQSAQDWLQDKTARNVNDGAQGRRHKFEGGQDNALVGGQYDQR